MRKQPDGVNRVPRGEARPAKEYDIFVDGTRAGWAERLADGAWRGYLASGDWRKFGKRGGFLAATEWIAEQYRAGLRTAEPATAAEGASVERLTAVVADPFRGDRFADPLAP